MVTKQLYWRKVLCGCFCLIWLWLLIAIMKRCAERCALQLYRTSLICFRRAWIEIILRGFFCFHNQKENKAVETHIPRHRDPKTKTLWYRETETIKPRHCYSKAFFLRTKSHNIGIPRLKNHDIEFPRPKSHGIEFLRDSDHYTPWYYLVGDVKRKVWSMRSAMLLVRRDVNM